MQVLVEVRRKHLSGTRVSDGSKLTTVGARNSTWVPGKSSMGC